MIATSTFLQAHSRRITPHHSRRLYAVLRAKSKAQWGLFIGIVYALQEDDPWEKWRLFLLYVPRVSLSVHTPASMQNKLKVSTDYVWCGLILLLKNVRCNCLIPCVRRVRWSNLNSRLWLCTFSCLNRCDRWCAYTRGSSTCNGAYCSAPCP